MACRLVIDERDVLWCNPVDCIALVWGYEAESARKLWQRVFSEDKRQFFEWCEPFSRSVFFRFRYRIQVYKAITDRRERRGASEHPFFLQRWLEVTDQMRSLVNPFPPRLKRCQAFHATPFAPFHLGEEWIYLSFDDEEDDDDGVVEEEKPMPLPAPPPPQRRSLFEPSRQLEHRVERLSHYWKVNESDFDRITTQMEETGAFRRAAQR